MGRVIDAADAEESKLGNGLATIATLGKANNLFTLEAKKFVYNICEQRTSSLMCGQELIEDLMLNKYWVQ